MRPLFLVICAAFVVATSGCASRPVKVGPLPNVRAVVTSNAETRAFIRETQTNIAKVQKSEGEVSGKLKAVKAGLDKLSTTDGPDRALVLETRANLDAALALRDLSQDQLAMANRAAFESARTAALTETRALEAEKQVATQHAELERAAAENARMRPIVAQVNRWWGAGAILYGVKRLGFRLLIGGAILAGVGAVVVFAFPPIGAALAVAGRSVASLVRRKR